MFFAAKAGEALNSKQKQDLELTGSDHQLVIAKFRLKLNKEGKTTGPVRYDLNQICWEYAVEVTDRFRDSYLVNRGPEELWTEVHNVIQQAVNKSIPKKKNYREAKWLSQEALQIPEETREVNSNR